MKFERLLFGLLAVLIWGFTCLDIGFVKPAGWPEPVYNFQKNPLDSAKIALGRMLFYDPVLSADSTISCASCHSPYNAFAHVDHELSHGISDRIGTRNAPALMNLAWQPVFMYDGAINHLDVQALAPISHPDEMGSSIANVVRHLKRSDYYPELFKRAFGSGGITGERTLKALTQFMLILVSSDSKYDRMQRGEVQFTKQETSGMQLFEANCASCHTPPLFTNHTFQNNGLPVREDLMDSGRQKITGRSEDSLFFKVPTLRNIGFTYPYMHDGRFKKLSEVVRHYAQLTDSVRVNTSLSKAIDLSADEQVDLISFLLTLNDRNFVFNRNYTYPKEIFDQIRGMK